MLRPYTPQDYVNGFTTALAAQQYDGDTNNEAYRRGYNDGVARRKALVEAAESYGAAMSSALNGLDTHPDDAGLTLESVERFNAEWTDETKKTVTETVPCCSCGDETTTDEIRFDDHGDPFCRHCRGGSDDGGAR